MHVVIRVKPGASDTTVRVIGGQGTSCVSDTRKLEAELGVATARELLPEYALPEQFVSQKQEVRQ